LITKVAFVCSLMMFIGTVLVTNGSAATVIYAETSSF